MTENGKTATKKAFRFSQLPDKVIEQTTRRDDGTITADPLEILKHERTTFGKLWKEGEEQWYDPT